MSLLPEQDRLKLRFGPYCSPRVRLGDTLSCEFRGLVEVVGWTDGKIPWPQGRVKGTRRRVIVCADLLKALRTESADTIAYHFGIHRASVWRWRKWLGIDSRLVDGYLSVMHQFGEVNGQDEWRAAHLLETNPYSLWSAGDRKELGRDTDVNVAKKINRTPSAVKHARQRSGIQRKQ